MHKEGALGVLGIPCLQGPVLGPIAKQNKQKTSRAGLGNHRLKRIYIPDALRNVSGASRIEGRTNSLEERNGFGPRGATFFLSSMASKHQGSKDQGKELQCCIFHTSIPRYSPSDLPT